MSKSREQRTGAMESKRQAVLDARPVNLDGFSHEEPEFGLIAVPGPYDPHPTLRIEDGRVVEMDEVAEPDFDIIDRFIASHGIDLEVAHEAMAMSDEALARAIVDFHVSRQEVARLVCGTTPAKLARVVATLQPVELQMAATKMRVRRTPSIQAHVTNQRDDPLLLGADAASAVAYGFRELETTVPFLADAASNALAILIGSLVDAPGALTQCSIEEALELELGMRGLTTYAETVSLYGTEQVFVDGDDTPWSKAFLCSAYASRGLKMRVTSGGGAEVLMGEAERRSTLYLESRCVAMARAMGAQGVQNGGIDGAAVVSSVPEGMRSLLGENVMVMLRDLESCSGNDTLISESDIRRSAHTVPLLLAGSDYLFSGFGAVPRYDNAFSVSNFNSEDIDDYLVLQRDWGVDGGLRPQLPEHLLEVRERGARAVRAVYSDLGLAVFDEDHVRAAIEANRSDELPDVDPLLISRASDAIVGENVTVLDVIASLDRTGYREEAESLVRILRARLHADYLQPAAIFDENIQVRSKITDPNDYCGPGSGYRLEGDRRAALVSIRQERSVNDLLQDQAAHSGHVRFADGPLALAGEDAREVCIGVSPAFGNKLWLTLSGLTIGEMLRQIGAGLEEEGCVSRILRIRSTIDTGLIGLTAARLAGSGIGIGVQAKGTAVIHRRNLAPLANLELYSMAPMLTAEMYRQLGKNAGRYAKGLTPVPAFKGGTEEAVTARYHARVVALVAIEREACEPGVPPIEVSVVA